MAETRFNKQGFAQFLKFLQELFAQPGSQAPLPGIEELLTQTDFPVPSRVL